MLRSIKSFVAEHPKTNVIIKNAQHKFRLYNSHLINLFEFFFSVYKMYDNEQVSDIFISTFFFKKCSVQFLMIVQSKNYTRIVLEVRYLMGQFPGCNIVNSEFLNGKNFPQIEAISGVPCGPFFGPVFFLLYIYN